jgi:hypothetical protein
MMIQTKEDLRVEVMFTLSLEAEPLSPAVPSAVFDAFYSCLLHLARRTQELVGGLWRTEEGRAGEGKGGEGRGGQGRKGTGRESREVTGE